MIALIVSGPPGDSHHLIYAIRRLGSLTVIEDRPELPSTPTIEAMTVTMTSFIKEWLEPEPVYHINGNLRYLYRPTAKPVLISRQSRYIIRQPCWRAGRWKSLT